METNVTESQEIREEAKEKIINTLSLLRKIVPFVVAAHKVVFYFTSNKYQISKRFTNINYILIRKWLQTSHSLYGYRILGVITIFQLLITFSITFYNYLTTLKVEPLKQVRKSRNSERESLNCESTCVLCLGPRQNPSLTTCGHIFCWECIHGWLEERDECPTCREHVKKANVLLLRNFM
ncbi:PEX10.2 family protein [Megaselia abdita]